MKIIRDRISKQELSKLAEDLFGNLVKVVIDIRREIMAVGGELHADEEEILIKDGSRQEDLWGINIYPDLTDENFIEFDSMINLRPSLGNYTRGVDDNNTREKIILIVDKLIIAR